MKFQITMIAALCAFLGGAPNSVQAIAWKSNALDARNAEIYFEVDSTWHLVHGKVSGIRGSYVMADERSVQGELSVPVKSFNTDSESRDERLREVMAEDKFPRVSFAIHRAEHLCTPDEIDARHPCEGRLFGALTIRDVTKEVVVPFFIRRDETRFTLTGQFAILWADYGVEDPSIFVASLYPEVTTHVRIDLTTTETK